MKLKECAGSYTFQPVSDPFLDSVYTGGRHDLFLSLARNSFISSNCATCPPTEIQTSTKRLGVKLVRTSYRMLPPMECVTTIVGSSACPFRAAFSSDMTRLQLVLDGQRHHAAVVY